MGCKDNSCVIVLSTSYQINVEFGHEARLFSIFFDTFIEWKLTKCVSTKKGFQDFRSNVYIHDIMEIRVYLSSATFRYTSFKYQRQSDLLLVDLVWNPAL